jgi:hypothetical protein
MAGGRPCALDRVRGQHPKYHDVNNAILTAAPARLSDAQLVIAREYGFKTRANLKERVTVQPQAAALEGAIRSGDRDAVTQILREHPPLLHLPVRSGNWGPPLSFAANLGRLDIVQAIACLGARDVQHAFDRARLQGHIACARWLHAHGAVPRWESVMGTCETLNSSWRANVPPQELARRALKGMQGWARLPG